MEHGQTFLMGADTLLNVIYVHNGLNKSDIERINEL